MPKNPMNSLAKKLLIQNLPVLFCNIAWSKNYDGTDDLKGDFAGLPKDTRKGWEAKAFVKDKNGSYGCGISKGKFSTGVAITPMHVVFVARDPADRKLKAVGLYAVAEVDANKLYPRVHTQNLIRLTPRPTLKSWPGKQGARRWAFRNNKVEHPNLFRFFNQIARASATQPRGEMSSSDQELNGVEGAKRRILINSRKRESKLRTAKIAAELAKNDGRLICEVPYCGFDFENKYGPLGSGFAHVHHKKPLASASPRGRKISLSDLAIVCAKCHAMIHKGGECRTMANLIPKGRRG